MGLEYPHCNACRRIRLLPKNCPGYAIATLVGWFAGFYGITTFVGYLMPNFVYTYIKPKVSKRTLGRNILDK